MYLVFRLVGPHLDREGLFLSFKSSNFDLNLAREAQTKAR